MFFFKDNYIDSSVTDADETNWVEYYKVVIKYENWVKWAERNRIGEDEYNHELLQFKKLEKSMKEKIKYSICDFDAMMYKIRAAFELGDIQLLYDSVDYIDIEKALITLKDTFCEDGQKEAYVNLKASIQALTKRKYSPTDNKRVIKKYNSMNSGTLCVLISEILKKYEENEFDMKHIFHEYYMRYLYENVSIDFESGIEKEEDRFLLYEDKICYEIFVRNLLLFVNRIENNKKERLRTVICPIEIQLTPSVVHHSIGLLGIRSRIAIADSIINQNHKENIDDIIYSDVIVKSSLRSCSIFGHRVQDIIANIQVIQEDGSLAWNRIHAGYCLGCGEYYILDTDYNCLTGVPVCKVYTMNILERESKGGGWSASKKESKLHAYGYNVSSNYELTQFQRERILMNIIDNGILSVEEILSHLDFLINRSKNNGKLHQAISKWKSDRKFVSDHWMLSNEIVVKKITKHEKTIRL